MFRQPLSLKHLLLGSIAVALVACNPSPTPTDGGGSDTGPIADTGPTPDTGHDSGAATSVCASAMAVTLPMGAHSVMGDTTGHTTGVLDLGTACGGMGMAMAGTTAPQQVLALTLPGAHSDTVAVNYTLANMGTNAMFDTTTQVRMNCMDATGAVCFDDISGTDYRSAGNFTGHGGDVRYLIIGGYRMPTAMHVNVGPFQVDFQTFLNPTAPTITGGDSSLLDGDLLTVHVMGSDPQMAAQSVQLSFLTAAGTAIGFDIDMNPMTPDVTDLGPYNFTPSIRGMANPFTGALRVTGFMPFPQAAMMATQLRITVIDAATLMSNTLMIPLVQAHTVRVGATCDASHICPAGVDCTGTPTVCTVPAAVAAACTAAVPLTIATPTTTTTSAMTTISFTTGTGNFEGSCIGTGGMGDDHVISVTVPAGGPFDLIAEAPAMAATGPDTIIYDRTVCGDPGTETACNDDQMAMPMHIVAARMVLQGAAPGAHFIVADTFATQTAAVMVPITVSLRPVLAAGATCDPMGVMNRCGGASPCPTTGVAHCP